MQSALFPNKIRSGVAALTSLVALMAVLFYVAAPSLARPVMTAAYSKSSRPLVGGVVKSSTGAAVLQGKVVLVFRTQAGRVVKRETVKTDRHGRFHAVAPKGAASVVLTAVDGRGKNAPRVSHTFTLAPGKALQVTAVFPKSGSGLLPGVFPY